MKRHARLRRSDQFQRVRREGRSVSSPLLSLGVAASRSREPRCGIVVGKRIGGAVLRNRARRRLREVIRLNYAAIALRHDLVFTIRSPMLATVEFAELQTLVITLLQRAHVWREPPLIRQTED